MKGEKLKPVFMFNWDKNKSPKYGNTLMNSKYSATMLLDSLVCLKKYVAEEVTDFTINELWNRRGIYSRIKNINVSVLSKKTVILLFTNEFWFKNIQLMKSDSFVGEIVNNF